jgi:hypothetical protein
VLLKRMKREGDKAVVHRLPTMFAVDRVIGVMAI